MDKVKELTITPRFRENIIETLDIKEMTGKYLAEEVKKTWTEDFLDQDTKEVVSIERTELLFKRGEIIDPNLASKIQFSIQAEEITKPIKVTDALRKGQLWESVGYHPMMVHVSTGLAKPWLLLWADSFKHAMDVAADYMEQIATDSFSIFEVKNLDGILVDRDEFYEKQQEQADKYNIALNPLRYYSIDAIWKEEGTPYPFIRPTKEAKAFLDQGSFIVMAESLDEAKDIVGPLISERALDQRGWKKTEIHWEKGKPFSASIIVPKWFCDEYRQYYKDMK